MGDLCITAQRFPSARPVLVSFRAAAAKNPGSFCLLALLCSGRRCGGDAKLFEWGMNYSACPRQIFCVSFYGMDRRRGLPSSPKARRSPCIAKINSDGTKLALVVGRCRTTAYGMRPLLPPELDASESRQFASPA